MGRAGWLSSQAAIERSKRLPIEMATRAFHLTGLARLASAPPAPAVRRIWPDCANIGKLVVDRLPLRQPFVLDRSARSVYLPTAFVLIKPMA